MFDAGFLFGLENVGIAKSVSRYPTCVFSFAVLAVNSLT